MSILYFLDFSYISCLTFYFVIVWIWPFRFFTAPLVYISSVQSTSRPFHLLHGKSCLSFGRDG